VNRLAALALACGLGLSVALACTDDRLLPPLPGGEERWARRFLPAGEPWIPESEIPTSAQATPAMVIWELNGEAAPSEPTAAQRQAADDLEERCLAVVHDKGWFDFEVALRDGYSLLYDDTRHFVNEAYLFDGRLLDCERPEFLMYYGTPAGKILAGMMFLVNDIAERGSQFGGSSTLWHYHIWNKPLCLRGGLLVVGAVDEGECADGEPQWRSPEMLHLWFLKHPQGRFGTAMWLSRANLEAALAERALE
jgi:hypothetical protein